MEPLDGNADAKGLLWAAAGKGLFLTQPGSYRIAADAWEHVGILSHFLNPIIRKEGAGWLCWARC